MKRLSKVTLLAAFTLMMISSIAMANPQESKGTIETTNSASDNIETTLSLLTNQIAYTNSLLEHQNVLLTNIGMDVLIIKKAIEKIPVLADDKIVEFNDIGKIVDAVYFSNDKKSNIIKTTESDCSSLENGLPIIK